MQVQQRQDWIRGRREKKKLARAARVRRQVLRYCLLVVMLAVAGCGFAFLPWRLADLDADVAVSGNQVVSVEQVRGVLASCVGKPLYKLDPSQLARQLTALEDVRYAFVRRYLFPRPHLVVEVLEEFPWASIGTDPEKPADAVIAQTGRRIPIAEFPGIVQPEFMIYAKPDLAMTAWQVKQWAEWISYISAQTGQKVDFVDMRNPQDVRVQNGDLHMKLGTPDTTLTRRLGRLASLMPAISPLRDRLEYVDLGLDNNIPLKIARKLPGDNGKESHINAIPGSASPDAQPLAPGPESGEAPVDAAPAPAVADPAEPM